MVSVNPLKLEMEKRTVPFGTKGSTVESELTHYLLCGDQEDIPPANIHTLNFPVEWPFLLDLNDYDAKDEASVRTINTITMAVSYIRSMGFKIDVVIEQIATQIKKLERGHTVSYADVGGSVTGVLSTLRWQEHVRNCSNEFSILADQCPSARVTELEQWCDSTIDHHNGMKNVIDEAVVYEETYNNNIGKTEADVDSVIAEQQYVDELIDAYKAYEAATTDVDLEGVVDDIYSTMDSIEVSL